MQLPGMSTDPIRLALDITYDPVSAEFSMSRRLWTRPHRAGEWQLEAMSCSGTPIPLTGLRDRWAAASQESYRLLMELVEDTPPFP